VLAREASAVVAEGEAVEEDLAVEGAEVAVAEVEAGVAEVAEAAREASKPPAAVRKSSKPRVTRVRSRRCAWREISSTAPGKTPK